MYYPQKRDENDIVVYEEPYNKGWFGRKLEKGKAADVTEIINNHRDAVLAKRDMVVAAYEARMVKDTYPERVQHAIAMLSEELLTSKLANAKTSSEISFINAQEERTRQQTKHEAEIHVITVTQMTESNKIGNAEHAVKVQKEEIKRNILQLEEQEKRIDVEKYLKDFHAEYGR